MAVKMLEKQEIEEKKAASRKAADTQAPHFDMELCGEHARSLYPSVMYEVRCAYVDFARREQLAGRMEDGVPTRPFRVLDVGCGTGALDEIILASLPACRLTGADISLEMLSRARSRLMGRATFVCADAEHLPFAEGFFDAVVCNDAFHHFPDPKRATFEMWRVLGRDGVLVMGDEWKAQPARAIVNLVKPLNGEGDVHVYSEGELTGLLRSWFSSVEWRSASSSSCIAVARK